MKLYRWGVYLRIRTSFVQICLHEHFVQFELFGVYRLYSIRFQSPIVIEDE
jgi:hypothetical protein